MTRGTVIIHLVRPAAALDAADMKILTAEECRRAGSFRFPHDSAHWASCRAAIRRILGGLTGNAPRDLPLQYGPSGKPMLAEPHGGIHFNLSHCRDLALLAVCPDGPVGIDLEPLDRAKDLGGCETTFCHPDEIAGLPDDDSRHLRMLEIWTAKEALLKAIGTGFSIPPETVRIHDRGGIMTATSDSPLEGLAEIIIRRPGHPALDGYLAAVATPRPVVHIRFVDSRGSTPACGSAMNPVSPD